MDSYGRVKAVITKIERFVANSTHDVSRTIVRHKLQVLERNYINFVKQADELFDSKVMSEERYDEEEKLYSAKYEAAKAALKEMYDTSLSDEGEESCSESDSNSNMKTILKQQTEILKKLCSPKQEWSSMKLPKIAIKPFNGNYADWKSFSNMFTTSIRNNKSLSSVERLYYLKSYLRGEAERIVKNISVTEDNFEVAWKLLETRYENDKLILDDIIRRFNTKKHVHNPKSELKDFATEFDEMLQALDCLGDYGRSRDPWIINRALSMLDEETVDHWAKYSVEIAEPSCEELLKFLQLRQSEIEITKSAALRKPTKFKDSKVLTVLKGGCYFCNGDHVVAKCLQLAKQSIGDRLKFFSSNRLCYNCLKKGHMANKCTIKGCCTKCRGKHNTLLHDEQFKTARDNSQMESKANKSIETVEASSNVLQVGINGCDSAKHVLLPTAEILVRCGDGRLVICRALMDVGSQVNLVSEAFFMSLGIPHNRTKRLLKGVSSDESQESRGSANITLCSKFDSRKYYCMETLIIKNLIGRMPENDINVNEKDAIMSYNLADDEFFRSKNIDILIGVNGYCLFTIPGKKYVRNDQLWMVNSIFGWLMCGGPENQLECHSVNATVVSNVDEQLERFWQMDHIGEECDEVNELEQSKLITRETDGRYVVKLPFVNEVPSLGESLRNAKKQFERLEFRFAKNPTFKKHYDDFMQEYIELNHMRKLSDTEIKSTQPHYYIPHHGIFQKDKIRVVFNASSKTSNGRSLNDELYPGPNLQSMLVDVITRIRRYRFIFATDVKKMYRQIRIHDDHSNFMRILWRNNSIHEIDHYSLLTVTYGTNCAPHSALRVMNQLVIDEGKSYPKAATVVTEQRYMDDMFGGANDIDEAIEIRDQLNDLMKKGCFQLGKWLSNDIRLLNGIDNDDWALEPMSFHTDNAIRTLGIVWHPKDDQYSFEINLEPLPMLTKRALLSELSKVFDPLGWLAPVIVKAKLLMQRVWLHKLNWDDVLPLELSDEWERIRNSLFDLRKMRLDRWFGDGSKVELHGFSDASKRAFGAVIYCHTMDEYGKIKRTLIAAKSRLAPLKEISIPRLELCAALLLSQLMSRYERLFRDREPIIRCWTDSKIVLSWIARQSNNMTIFVRNRIKKIIQNHPIEFWNYVQTKLNPADVVSRGQYADALVMNELWWLGPQDTIDDNADVDCEKSEDSNIAESIQGELSPYSQCNTVMSNDGCDLNAIVLKFPSIFRLKRFVALAMRLGNRVKGKDSGHSAISLAEMNDGLKRLVMLTQKQYFKDEYEKCKNGKSIRNSGSLAHLTPFVDDHGILRVGGRLTNANMPRMEMHPIIIPYGHLAELIVREVHISNMHCGVRQTIFLCRKYYWIIRINRLVKKEVRFCVRCLRFRGKTYKPMMGSLPAYRVSEIKPFYRTGVDYAGPFSLRAFRHRGNLTTHGYVSVFVCLATKAVHFEIVTSLDTSSFIAAYERFVARRGNCAQMWSDNGRNFIGTCNYLKKLQRVINESDWSARMKLAMMRRNVEWNFIPPYAPHFGGLWESAVRIMKMHLVKSVSGQILTIEEFSTVLCRIEMIMNSRPLTPMTNDPEDCEAITPSHFLTGEGVHPIAFTAVPTMSMKQRLRLIQELTEKFWSSWRREYLKSIIAKTKWLQGQRRPILGELVLVKRDFQPPGSWKMARIVRLIPGNDDEVRVVETFDGRRRSTEAVINLVPIELNADGSTGGECWEDNSIEKTAHDRNG